MNAEIIKRLQDTLDFDDHIKAAPTPTENDFDQYGPSVTGVASKADQILQELKKLQMTITSLRVGPMGELEFVAEPKINKTEHKEEPFPAPTDEEALQSLAHRLGYKVVRKKKS